ncbi:hypothetical protein CRYUN_Cryun18bG0053100 [Craigia yunnanensis]
MAISITPTHIWRSRSLRGERDDIVVLESSTNSSWNIPLLTGDFDESSLEFQRKILERSGLGEETCVPEAMHYLPPKPSMAAARQEAEQVMFAALDTLFANTNIKPRDIGILVVNCSLFNPTPSLSAMIINKYKLTGNIRSFNLGGMGCSAGVIAVDLVKDMLQVHRNSYAIVVSTENITQNWSRMMLEKLGFLSNDLMAIAGGALKTNIITLGPLVLPISEQILFFVTLVAKKLFNAKIKPYIPDFKLAYCKCSCKGLCIRLWKGYETGLLAGPYCD